MKAGAELPVLGKERCGDLCMFKATRVRPVSETDRQTDRTNITFQ